jgi:hypothetical protein
VTVNAWDEHEGIHWNKAELDHEEENMSTMTEEIGICQNNRTGNQSRKATCDCPVLRVTAWVT